MSKNVHATVPQGIVGGFGFSKKFERMARGAKGGGGVGFGHGHMLRVLKESKALRLDTSRLRERREGRAKMSDVPAETGNGL